MGQGQLFGFIPKRIATLEELWANRSVFELLRQCADGLILVGGPTGSGKSSTLAALVDQLNRERSSHIDHGSKTPSKLSTVVSAAWSTSARSGAIAVTLPRDCAVHCVRTRNVYRE